MKEKKMKTLEFKNLPKDIQDKIVKQEIDDMYEFDSQYDPDVMLGGFVLKLRTIGFKLEIDDIRYSGFCSQGDGLSFVGELDIGVFCTKVLADHENKVEFGEDVIAMLEKYKNDIGVFKVVRKYANYVHEKSVEFDFEDFNDAEFMSFLEGFRYELCILMYTELKDYHDEFLIPANVQTRLEEINMYWTLESPFESFEDKPFPTYDYNVAIDYDKVKELNLSIIDINNIAAAELEIIKTQNTLDLIPYIKANQMLFIEGRNIINNNVLKLKGYYNIYDGSLVRELPECKCTDPLMHDADCLYNDLLDEQERYVPIYTDVFNVSFVTFARNMVDCKFNYDFEDNLENESLTQLVVYVYSIEEYFKALEVVENINSAIKDENNILNDGGNIVYIQGVSAPEYISMTVTIDGEDKVKDPNGCVL